MASRPTLDGRPAPTVLVVEDSESVRTLTARLLVGAGYPVVTALDGVEAIEVLERSSIRLVVTDLKMPRMGGQELAAQVTRRWPDVRMVFMTGHPEVLHAAELPGPVLLKPFRLDELTATVRALVDTDGTGR
ncbi:MAG TPA: response regulator [Gemmatimonadales bacterium]|nr:response regulator [Gemmatimonadales bacterium]